MRKAKPRLARNIQVILPSRTGDDVQVAVQGGSKWLEGALAVRLTELGATGIRFLDKRPLQTSGHLFVLGLSHGVLVVYLDYGLGQVYSQKVSMCSTFRTRLVGGVGKLRWAKVVTA